MLAKKVDTLTKAMEVEARKMRREVAVMEKEVAAMRVEKDHENRAKRFGSSKGPVTTAQLLPGRYLSYFYLSFFLFKIYDCHCMYWLKLRKGMCRYCTFFVSVYFFHDLCRYLSSNLKDIDIALL